MRNGGEGEHASEEREEFGECVVITADGTGEVEGEGVRALIATGEFRGNDRAEDGEQRLDDPVVVLRGDDLEVLRSNSCDAELDHSRDQGYGEDAERCSLGPEGAADAEDVAE